MSFDLEKAIKSKQRFRRELAARPIAEKLAMLDKLRERSLTLRSGRTVPAKVLYRTLLHIGRSKGLKL